MCAPLNGFDGEEPTGTKSYRLDEEFSWTMPFEIIQDDLRSVHMNAMQLGKELVEDFQQKITCGGIPTERTAIDVAK